MTIFTDDELAALEALEFARLHDWGRHARLYRCPVNGPYIINLIDAYTINGEYRSETTSVPATVQALREFGNY